MYQSALTIELEKLPGRDTQYNVKHEHIIFYTLVILR